MTRWPDLDQAPRQPGHQARSPLALGAAASPSAGDRAPLRPCLPARTPWHGPLKRQEAQGEKRLTSEETYGIVGPDGGASGHTGGWRRRWVADSSG